MKKYQKISILRAQYPQVREHRDEAVPAIAGLGGNARRRRYHAVSARGRFIIKWLQDFARQRGDIEYLTIELFPSITIIKKHQK